MPVAAATSGTPFSDAPVRSALRGRLHDPREAVSWSSAANCGRSSSAAPPFPADTPAIPSRLERRHLHFHPLDLRIPEPRRRGAS